MKNYRALALFTSVSLLLAACNGTQAPSAVATIEVTGPQDVKLNEPATFTAVVKTADGTVLTDKKVSWNYSAGDVTSDASGNGVVIARQFGDTTTLTATVDGVKADKVVRTYGLQAFAGLRDSGFDTAMFFRYRTKTGADPVNALHSFSVTGPGGWYGNQAVSFDFSKSTYFPDGDGSGRHFFEFGWTKTGVVPAVMGAYTIRFMVDGEEWTSTAQITSMSNSVQGGPRATVTEHTGTSVKATWNDVAPNGSYAAEVFGSGDFLPAFVNVPAATIQARSSASSAALLARRSLSISKPATRVLSGELSPLATDAYVGVHALSLDITAPVTTSLSGQFDVTYGTSDSFTP